MPVVSSGGRRGTTRTPRGGYQPQWVNFARQPADPLISATSGLSRTQALTGQPLEFDSAFVALRVRYVPRDHRLRLVQAQQTGSGAIYFNVGGSSTADAAGKSKLVTSSNVGGTPPVALGFFADTSYDLQRDARETIFAFSVNGSTGAMHTAIFEFGWQVWTSGYVTGGINQNIAPVYPTLNMTQDSNQWDLFGDNYGFWGDAAWLWFRHTNDLTSFVDLTLPANLALLLGDPTNFTFATPDIWFQGNAAEWNSGVNRGAGGNFVMGFPVTDAIERLAA